MAPGAELHCLKVSDLVGLQNAADYIANNNIQIANHSVAWAYASYYDGTGPVNAVINDSRNNDGVFWTISSGNFARKHWRGTWLDTDGDNTLEFAAGDELLALQGSAGSIAVFLNWNQYDTSTRTDLRFELLNSLGTVVAFSDGKQTKPFPELPYEAIGFSYQSSQAPYSIRVSFVGGVNPSGLDITLFSFNHDFEHRVAASSLMDPASAPGAFSVGAVNQASWQQANPPVESFSSQGPTNDGRQKPELVAPDGTSSLTYTTAFGTSFSAPTTAGAAALLLQESPGLTAGALGSLLMAEAIDLGAAGADPVYGAGKLQLPLIDSDSDGLSNVEEIDLGTDALDSDSDNDGLTDFEETRTYGTDPLAADSDADGLTDYEEVVIYATDPLASNLGDLAPRSNPDGIINVADYLVLTRLVNGVIEPIAAESMLGDLNDNGNLDGGDLVLLLQTVLGAPAAP
jgi:subtilisin family serine protease